MSKHTPTPYRWQKDNSEYYLIAGEKLNAEQSNVVLSIPGGHSGGDFPSPADGDFIITACNYHDRLVGLLEALTASDPTHDWYGCPYCGEIRNCESGVKHTEGCAYRATITLLTELGEEVIHEQR